MNIELIKDAGVEVLRNLPYKPFLCLPMSAVLYAILKDNHGMEARLITGDLRFNNEYIFRQDFRIKSVTDGKFKEWSGHAWVEVDDYICDLSFFRTLYSDSFSKPCKQTLINAFGKGRGMLLAKASDLKTYGLFYDPVDHLNDSLATGIIHGLKSLL